MISSMLQYIQKSPDCFHAVENLRQRLMGEGYTQLTAGEWSLTPGGKYFITKNGSSLLAFRVPQGAPTGFVLTASHSDSPCFRLRDHAELAGEFVRLSAERYGGTAGWTAPSALPDGCWRAGTTVWRHVWWI